jgi:hypothetical protein
MIGKEGEKLARPYDVNLWEALADTSGARSVICPVDPKTTGIDPLTYL